MFHENALLKVCLCSSDLWVPPSVASISSSIKSFCSRVLLQYLSFGWPRRAQRLSCRESLVKRAVGPLTGSPYTPPPPLGTSFVPVAIRAPSASHERRTHLPGQACTLHHGSVRVVHRCFFNFRSNYLRMCNYFD